MIDFAKKVIIKRKLVLFCKIEIKSQHFFCNSWQADAVKTWNRLASFFCTMHNSVKKNLHSSVVTINNGENLNLKLAAFKASFRHLLPFCMDALYLLQ